VTVRQEAPRLKGSAKYPELAELAAKALANRGEWFACDRPAPLTPGNSWTSLRLAVISQIEGIEVKSDGDTLYVRIGECL
jgi:hypothetical protein